VNFNRSAFLVARNEMRKILSEKMIPFWLDRSIDDVYGGYLTSFDEHGVFDGDDRKYIVTQSRMLWGFSALIPYAKPEDRARMASAARQGARFFIDRFWDREFGGFYWKLNRDGSVGDPAKLTYGESFAIYALSEYSIAYQDKEALEYATRAFELLQTYAADTQYGGYLENLERDFSPSPGGAFAGDRKSLDIHMHLLEAFTTLYQAGRTEITGRKLLEVTGLILHKMVDRERGFGFNQFDTQFHKIPAIDIARTWNAERAKGEKIETPTDTTSYGHNAELSWLMDLALDALGADKAPFEPVMRKLLDHTLNCGFDDEYGGVYRDGVADGPALVTDKEWWQNFESMVGFSNGLVRYENERCGEAFLKTWAFVKQYFLDPELGESHQLLRRDGEVLVGNLGNPWKGIYHTGRALSESIKRLDALLGEKDE
jgi:cellobiose epimerase